MPSTYSNIKIQLMATGENNTTWGNVTNINLGTALEEAIVGSADVTFASGNVTLTLTDTNASQTARHVRLRCTGVTGGSTRDLIVPAIEKPYLVQNDCLNSIVVKNATGTGVTVPAGKTMWVYNDGTNVVDAVNHLSSLTLGTALPVGQGGTGASTFTANGIIYGNTTSALLATAAGTTGQVLVGNTGGAPSWATLTGIGVTSFSGGTTGLTPASPTTGAITLAGTLGVANGGTGTATQFTAGSVVFAGASGVYSQDNANLFWDNTNNYLGVGTATPSAPFHVRLTTDRNARFLNAYSSVAIGSTTDVGAEAPLAFFANPITFVTNNIERMRIDASGNVGVATSTPTALLTVNGTAKVGEGVATNTSKFMVNTLSGVAAGIQLIQDANESWIIQNPASTNVLTFSNSGTERMRITAAGNVGIGTAFPSTVYRQTINGDGSSILGGLSLRNNGTETLVIGNITATNDVDSEIWNPRNGFLRFATNNAERMRIDASGNVGIGTASPSSYGKFTVVGSGDIANFDTPSGATGIALFENGQGRGRIRTLNGSTGLAFLYGSTEGMRITSAGFVGIGTTAPAVPLDVRGTVSIGTASSSYLGANYNSEILAGVDAGGYYYASGFGAASNIPITMGDRASYIAFKTSPSTAAGFERMRITGTGDVGIGTGTPATRLEVSTNTGTETLKVTQTDASGSSIARIRLSHGSGAQGVLEVGAGYGALGLTTSGPFVFSTNNNERMRIDATGNVGIGTNNPTVPLDVFNSSGGWIRFRNNSGEGELFADGAAALLGSVNAIPLLLRTGSVERMRITVAGDVGIGTSAPISKFEVTGGYITSGTVSSTGGAKILAGQWSGTEHLTTFGSEYSSGGPALGYAVWPSTTTFASFVSATSVSQPRTAYTLSGGSHIWYTGGTQTVAVGSPVVMAETMRIDGAGRVGIGTASPSSKLNVLDGDIEIGATGLGNTLLSFNGTTASLTVNSSSAPLTFGTNSTERMRITSAGLVGIGTASPGYLFDVNGQARLGGSSGVVFGVGTAFAGGQAEMYSVSTTPLGIGTTGAASMQLYTNSTERMRITSAGNVGIGTSAPGARLNVELPSYGVTALFTTADGTGNPRLAIYGSSSGTTIQNTWSSGASNLIFANGGAVGSGTEAMRIDNAGFVGIGTGSPTSKLFVEGTIQARSGATGVLIYGDGSGAGYIQSAAASNSLIFQIGIVERMRLDGNGNLGIGTSAPSLPLVVSNAGTTGIEFSPSGGIGGGTYIQSYNRNTATYTPNTNYAASQTWYVGATRAMDLDSSGNLLVGTTTSDGYRFKTEGSYPFLSKGTGGAALTAMSIWNNDTAGDNLFIVFSTEAGGTTRGSIDYNRAGGLTRYNTTSDYRAKDIVGPTQNSGKVVDALKVYDGKMKGATIERPMLIAHEAQEVVPYAVTGEKDAVNEDGTPKFQQIDVSSLVPLLIAEIQSLRARVAQLEGK